MSAACNINTKNIKDLIGKKVCITWVKYPFETYNHLAIGEILGANAYYLTLEGKTYHFNDKLPASKDVASPEQQAVNFVESKKTIRYLPWGRIEMINELPQNAKWDEQEEMERKVFLSILDGRGIDKNERNTEAPLFSLRFKNLYNYQLL